MADLAESRGQIDIKKICAGDEAEFKRFYCEYAQKVFRYVLTKIKDYQKSEEIVQDSFYTFWEQRGNIYSKNIIWSIAAQKCIDLIRKSNKDRVLRDLDDIKMVDKNPNIDSFFSAEEEKYKIFQLLTSEQKEIFELCIQGLTRKEISLKLGIPLGTVDSRLCRIKKMLKEKL